MRNITLKSCITKGSTHPASSRNTKTLAMANNLQKLSKRASMSLSLTGELTVGWSFVLRNCLISQIRPLKTKTIILSTTVSRRSLIYLLPMFRLAFSFLIRPLTARPSSITSIRSKQTTKPCASASLTAMQLPMPSRWKVECCAASCL